MGYGRQSATRQHQSNQYGFEHWPARSGREHGTSLRDVVEDATSQRWCLVTRRSAPWSLNQYQQFTFSGNQQKQRSHHRLSSRRVYQPCRHPGANRHRQYISRSHDRRLHCSNRCGSIPYVYADRLRHCHLGQYEPCTANDYRVFPQRFRRAIFSLGKR